MERHELLQDKTRENKDPQKVTAWHPKHNPIPSILKTTYHLISNFQTIPYCCLPKKQNTFLLPS